MKKFLYYLYLPLAVAMLVIGLSDMLSYEKPFEGLAVSYPYFMLASIFLLLYKYQKPKKPKADPPKKAARKGKRK